MTILQHVQMSLCWDHQSYITWNQEKKRKNTTSELNSNPDTLLKSKGTKLRFEIYVFILCICAYIYIYTRTNPLSLRITPTLQSFCGILGGIKLWPPLHPNPFITAEKWESRVMFLPYKPCSLSCLALDTSVHPLPPPACLKGPTQISCCKHTQRRIILGRPKRSNKHTPPIFPAFYLVIYSFLAPLLWRCQEIQRLICSENLCQCL